MLKELHTICLDNQVSITKILPIFGQGHWNFLGSDDGEFIEELFVSNFHPTVQLLLDQLGNDVEPANFLEAMIQSEKLGMLVELSVPVPRDFFTYDENPTKDSPWSWSSSQSWRQVQVVYIENLEDLKEIIPAFKLKIVQRELEKHLNKQR